MEQNLQHNTTTFNDGSSSTAVADKAKVFKCSMNLMKLNLNSSGLSGTLDSE